MNRAFPIIALLLLTAGCLGDPDAASGIEALQGRTPVPESAWRNAVPGCEDVGAAAAFARLHPLAGQPLLGGLMTPEGELLCVDAVSVLAEEHEPGWVVPIDYDPTPTPLSPDPTERVYSPR